MFVGGLCLFSVLAGCSTIGNVKAPTVKKEEMLFAEHVVTAMKCELALAAHAVRSHPDTNVQRYADQDVAATIQMTVTEVVTPSGKVALVVPVGSNTLGIDFGNSETQRSKATMKFELSLKTATLEPCDPAGVKVLPGLGLKEWIASYAKIAQTSKAEEIGLLSYSVEFQIQYNPSIGLKFTRALSAPKKGSFSPGASGSRTVNHLLTLTAKSLVRGTPPLDAPLTQLNREFFEDLTD